MFKYNDYELIYMIKDNNDAALNLMYEKYTPFIYMIIRDMNIYDKYKDDFLQEGYMSLNDAIRTYDMNYNKTFYKYFEVILRRRYYRLYKTYSKLDVPVEDLELTLGDKPVIYNKDASLLFDRGFIALDNKLEKDIYISLYKEGLSYKEVASKYNINIKKVYNTIQKIKKVLNKNIKC